MWKFLLVVVFLSLQNQSVHSGIYYAANETRVVQLYLDSLKDDPRVVPLQVTRQPLTINVTIQLNQIIQADPTKNTLEVSTTVIGAFRNPFYTWNWNETKVDGVKRPADSLWLPSFKLGDAIDRNIFRATEDVFVFPNGYPYMDGIYFIMSPSFKFICIFDIFLYPFDSTVCNLSLSADNSNIDEIEFVQLAGSLPLKNYKPHPEWNLDDLKTAVQVKTQVYSNDLQFDYSSVTVTISLSRRPGSYISSIMLPIFILGFLSLVTFLLPFETGERIGLGVSLLLAYTLFQELLFGSLPKSAKVPVISILIGVFESLSAGSLLVSIICMKVIHMVDGSSKPPQWIMRPFTGRSNREVKPLSPPDDDMEKQVVDEEDPIIYQKVFKEFAGLVNKICFYFFILFYVILLTYFIYATLSYKSDIFSSY